MTEIPAGDVLDITGEWQVGNLMNYHRCWPLEPLGLDEGKQAVKVMTRLRHPPRRGTPEVFH